MALLVNYNDGEWIKNFISNVLTDDDLGLIFDNEYKGNYIFDLAKKAGYTAIEKFTFLIDGESLGKEESTFVYINENGKIKEDRTLEKFKRYIMNNKLFTSRLEDLHRERNPNVDFDPPLQPGEYIVVCNGEVKGRFATEGECAEFIMTTLQQDCVVHRGRFENEDPTIRIESLEQKF